MPERLAVTFIDVGWGDSILVESDDATGKRRFGLVDCNDYETQRSSLLFVKRHFERTGFEYKGRLAFEWMLVTHGHADHARGIKRMMRTFGTNYFLYSEGNASIAKTTAIDFARGSTHVREHDCVWQGKSLRKINFGPVSMDVLWPVKGVVDNKEENNNSIVLSLTLGKVRFVLTGDAIAENWQQDGITMPDDVTMFQVPHHGGHNGMFDGPGSGPYETPWLNQLDAQGGNAVLALSSHTVPHGHPHRDVVEGIGDRPHRRTDLEYHLTFRTDGETTDVQYSRV